MSDEFKNCWEIMRCGRERNGHKTLEFGECIASKDGLGHSCWAIAGTLCGGEVQGTAARKYNSCMVCEVYKKYHRSLGSQGKFIRTEFPKEDTKYQKILMKKFNM